MINTADDKLSYTIPEAAAATGLGRSSLYEEIKAGSLWTFKAKGRTLILREVLAGYIADRAAPYRPTLRDPT